MRTFLRRLGIALLAFIALVVTLYIGIGVSGEVQQARQRDDIRDDIVTQEREARTAAGRLLPARLGAQTATASQVVCDLDSVDAGWIVQNYEQYCRRDATDVYATSAPPRRLARHLNLPLDVDDTTGCASFGELVAWVPLDRVDSPSPSCASTALPRLSAPPAYGGVVALDQRQADLAETPAGATGFLVVTSTTEAGRWDIGCDHWSVVFCSQPFDVAIPEPEDR